MTSATSNERAAVSSEGDSAALLTTVQRVRAGELPPASLERPLRAASLVVELDRSRSAAAGENQVVSVHAQGLSWLPAFSSPEQMANYCVRRGDDGDAPVSYGWLTGAALLDEVLPQLPPRTGIVLDPAAEHVFALPLGGAADER